MTSAETARLDALISNSYRGVFNLAYRLSGNRSDAEDLAQEACYRACRGIESYQGDRPFANWIDKIVVRLYLDSLRSRSRRVNAVSFDQLPFEVPDRKNNPEDEVLGRVIGEPLQLAFKLLNPDQQHLLALADIDELPYCEIAQMVGSPTGTVRSRLHRIRRRMRDTLDAIEERRISAGGPDGSLSVPNRA